MQMNLFTEIQKTNIEPDTYTPFLISSLKYTTQIGLKSIPYPELSVPIKKHRILKEYQDNIFIPIESKRKMLEDFCRAQRTYFAFSKFAQICRYKTAKSTISTDLYMNPIDPKHKNTICIHHQSTNYWFMVADLINLANAALTNSPYYFADPIPIKNPYTNIPFTNAHLYTIYFKIRASTFLIPVLFHNFFMCDFELIRFRLDHESEIREHHLTKYVYMTEENTLFIEIVNMISARRKKRLWYTHVDAPRSELVKIMRPYLYLHMIASYHVSGLEKQGLADDILNMKLRDLYKFNPLFGRIQRQKNKSISYNLDHPKFFMKDVIQLMSFHH